MAGKRKKIKKAKKSAFKKFLKAVGSILAVIVLVAAGYVAYVFISYHRIPDNTSLEVVNPAGINKTISQNTEYQLVTWNLGFGAYSDDFTFFMDGGKESRAFSKDSVNANIAGIVEQLKEINADFMLLQEVDFDSTRSYHVDEREPIITAFGEMSHVFAVNYDSPYLFYPLLSPHGASKSGLLTLSSCKISSSLRRSLPIEKGFMKFLDLDRCFSVSRLDVENGKQLVLVNLHLSAYTSDGGIATKQLQMLVDFMEDEVKAGNYIICGGDFNKDLLGNSPQVFGVAAKESFTWANPIPDGLIPEGLSLIYGLDNNDPVPSTRNTDIPYKKGVSFCATLDGFIVSSNIISISCATLDCGFKNTDHNPVVMKFTLE